MNITTLARFRPSKEESVGSGVEKLAADFDERLDTILTWAVPQDEFYNKYFKTQVNSTLQSQFNNTIIAYGYSGSGKTYTLNGMIRLALEDMATHVKPDIEISLAVVEIYVEKVYDLLEPGTAACILGDGTIVSTQVTSRARDVRNLEERLQRALDNRRTRATSLNQDSSRSHTLVILEVQGARLYIVDLAGCERVSDSKASGIGLTEAIAINKSLSSLHAVVVALSDQASVHIPYRNSKITMALKQALGGNSRTAFILCCASEQATLGESRYTLEFGTRCKAIVTAPVSMARKKTAKDLLIEHLRARISALETMVPAETPPVPSPLELCPASTHTVEERVSTLSLRASPELTCCVLERVPEGRKAAVHHRQCDVVPETLMTLADIALQVVEVEVPKKIGRFCCC